ncbi:hypothetical protein EHP00_946 [Ecytonucleospora hepatopenaei]|uniref:Kinetochore protein SPC25 n=1 Tax=Ecytonucleospora hepatopenaei TaxID=646526 RepID=A0A1W0E721_9MICR|nr:hypothetical protein EHP00_946 [Ecytonucleospora hepatopenaei]
MKMFLRRNKTFLINKMFIFKPLFLMQKEFGQDVLKIKQYIDEIKSRMNDTIFNVKAKMNGMKTDFTCSEKNIMDENTKLLKQINFMKENFAKMNKLKIQLKEQIKSNQNDINELQKENENYQSNETALRQSLKSLKNELNEIEENIDNLNVQKMNVVEKNKTTQVKFEQENGLIKKYLGIDYKILDKTTIKIFFVNSNKRCWMVLNFNSDNLVVNTEPKVNLEKISTLYKNHSNFYIFLREVRKELLENS